MAPTHALAVAALLAFATSAAAALLTPGGTIPLPNAVGRIDHLAADRAKGSLFVAALGSDRVFVVDLERRTVVHTISGLSQPQGLWFAPESERLYVANGGDGTLRVFAGPAFAAGRVIGLEDDADNIRFDPNGPTLYVGAGDGSLAIVDANRNEVVGRIPLGAHPESFQLERSGDAIFVNLPRTHVVAVVDRRNRKVTARWPLVSAQANFAMTLDEPAHRVFVGCRAPARLLVYDTASGREIAALELHADCDDLFFDAQRHRIYASCGAGWVDVFAQAGADTYRRLEAVQTAPGARTCLLVGNQLYVAVPRSGERGAYLQVFDLGD
jgi:DNA-binding beta-propeller fold protein YncE